MSGQKGMSFHLFFQFFVFLVYFPTESLAVDCPAKKINEAFLTCEQVAEDVCRKNQSQTVSNGSRPATSNPTPPCLVELAKNVDRDLQKWQEEKKVILALAPKVGLKKLLSPEARELRQLMNFPIGDGPSFKIDKKSSWVKKISPEILDSLRFDLQTIAKSSDKDQAWEKIPELLAKWDIHWDLGQELSRNTDALRAYLARPLSMKDLLASVSYGMDPWGKNDKWLFSSAPAQACFQTYLDEKYSAAKIQETQTKYLVEAEKMRSLMLAKIETKQWNLQGDAAIQVPILKFFKHETLSGRTRKLLIEGIKGLTFETIELEGKDTFQKYFELTNDNANYRPKSHSVQAYYGFMSRAQDQDSQLIMQGVVAHELGHMMDWLIKGENGLEEKYGKSSTESKQALATMKNICQYGDDTEMANATIEEKTEDFGDFVAAQTMDALFQQSPPTDIIGVTGLLSHFCGDGGEGSDDGGHRGGHSRTYQLLKNSRQMQQITGCHTDVSCQL